jgi:biotin carboxyl carrier protein
MPNRYTATVDGAEHEIEVEQLAANLLRLKFGERQFEVDVRRVGRLSFSIIVNNRSFDLEVVYAGEGMIVTSRGVATRVTLEDDRRRLRYAAAAGRANLAGKAELKAMMHGRVVNLLVKVGDEVGLHQGVIVVEAMKMENELKSPKAGRVLEVKVEAGQTVEKGELLVVIE